MPKIRFAVLWRDFDETVISGCRWGIYSPFDRTGEGRLIPPKEITDIRNKVAWYWITFHNWLLDFIEPFNDIVFIPFSIIKNREITKIQEVFEKLEARVPDSKLIEAVLNEKYNAARHLQDVPKIWDHYDKKASEITARLVAAAKP
jgi:hypothetical protein